MIGSNGDCRNWEIIMASYNKIGAAIAPTGQLYNSSLTFEKVNNQRYKTLNFEKVIASKIITNEKNWQIEQFCPLHC